MTSETPDTHTHPRYGGKWSRCPACETPDTPSTEALPGLAAQVEWQIGKAYANGHRDGLSCGVESAGLGFTGCDHLTEDGYRPSAIRQEAADTSGLREALVRIGRLLDGRAEHWSGLVEAIRREVDAALRGATERPLDGACNDPACAYREEVRLGRLVTVEALQAAERRATETLSAVVVAAGGEVRVPDLVVVAGSSLRVEPEPVSHETVYYARLASPTTTEEA